jgi:hypothetical protein
MQGLNVYFNKEHMGNEVQEKLLKTVGHEINAN